MLRHVTLRPVTRNGKSSWLLLGSDGRPIEAFTAFVLSMRHSRPNTRKAYSRHVAEFLDYLIEASLFIGQGRQLTSLELSETIEAWGDYLVHGTEAGPDIAKAVAASLPPGANAAATVTLKKAALRRFLKLSEAVRKQMEELAHLHVGISIASTPLLVGTGDRRELTRFERSALNSNSMIAGVVAGGPKFIDQVVLGKGTQAVKYEEARAFPYDKVMDLLDVMPSARDKALYALLAASGARTHEALQLLLDDDVDIEAGTLRLVDPFSRLRHPSYLALTALERDHLWWKGRATDLTLLIEPFASTFFEALHVYLSAEHIPHGKHDFLFQYGDRNKRRGLPFFLSDVRTRLEVFDRACDRVGVRLPPKTGPHSLRHMYGTYTLNYFPRSNGDYGLPVPMVQQLMGHADVKQTLKYARFDKDLLKLELQHANNVLFRHGTPKRLVELKLEALDFQVARIRDQLANETSAHD